MTSEAIPVVRTGSIAAWDQPGVRWKTLDPPSVRRWRARTAHLVDVRSWGGFSGSPFFIQFQVPGPRLHDLPDRWASMATDAGNDPAKLGEIHTFTIWFGVFAAHIEESGIGVVIPSRFVFEVLQGGRPM